MAPECEAGAADYLLPQNPPAKEGQSDKRGKRELDEKNRILYNMKLI